MIDQEQALLAGNVATQLLHYPTETTFLDSPIQNIKLQALKVVTANVYRNTLLLSNAPSVPNGLHVLTTCVLIYALILMNVHLYVRYVGRLSPVSTIGNVTRVCIQVRRSLFAKESSNKAANGAAGDDSLERMPWAAISDPRPDASALSLYSMKKPSSGNVSGMSNGCKTCTICRHLNQSLLTQTASQWMRAGTILFLQHC
jgi:hypothetical protein